MSSSTTDGRRLEQLRRLTEISRALTYATSLEQVLNLAVDRAAELLEADQAVLMLSDDDGLLRIRAARGIDPGRIARFREPLDESLLHRLQGILGDIGADAFLGVPLVVRGVVTGLLAVVRPAGTPGADTDEWLLSALADQAAVALENARLADEVQHKLEAHGEAIERALNTRDRALTTLSHDLRTPLNAIDSYAELIEMGLYGPVTDRQLEALGRIRLSGRHLLAVLNNVMEMARLSAGVIRVQPGDVALTDVLKEAVRMLQPNADAKEQVISVNAPADLVVHADSDRLRQVLLNLISNAIKYTPPRGTIRVAVDISDRAGQRTAAIQIADTGPGIPQDMMEAIFEPYYRLAATSSEPGVGLGLPISRELIRRMGGDIRVTSNTEIGTTFTIWLPLEARNPRL